MTFMHSEYQNRLDHWIRTLKADFYHELIPLSFEGFTTMEYLTPEAAAQGPFVPVREGMRWGHEWEYMWLRTRVTLPQEAGGERIVLNLDLSGEATLFVEGEAFGTRRADWVSVPHHYYEDNVLCESGVPGDTYGLLFEVYAGHYIPEAEGARRATGPIIPGTFVPPADNGERARIGHSSIGIFEEEAYQLYIDVMTLREVMQSVSPDSLRAARIADALEEFTRIVDFEQPREERVASYRAARARLKEPLSAHNGTTAPRYYAVGHAHLDIAYLWPFAETCRKTARTFAQQLRQLERYHEYRFIQSQAASYEMCSRHYPKLYKRVKQAIQEGRFIADGAMYVEPDTNIPCAEALIRQIAYGKQYFKDEFGVDSQLLWLPDTFGYTAALPQILQGCNVKYMVTQKIFWNYNAGERFPYHYFYWRGMDGSEITSFLPTSYAYTTNPMRMNNLWEERAQKRDLDSFLVPFGYGDGGGGPCRDDLEFLRREKDLEGMPRVEMTHPVRFFEDMYEKGGPRHTWVGELYFGAHRGTYTTQANVKRGNRKSEIALREAEIWGALAGWIAGCAYPAGDMEKQWKMLLLCQFHDILPGSCVARVYEEVQGIHAGVIERAAMHAGHARMALTDGGEEGITLFNSLSWPRTVLVTLPEAFAHGARSEEGERVHVLNGQALVTIGPMGSVSLRPEALKAAAPRAFARLEEQGAVLENERIFVRIGAQGEILSLMSKKSGHEFAGKKALNRLRMYKDTPRAYDAWDIDSNYVDQPVALEERAQISVAIAQGLRAAIRIRRALNHSWMEQIISLSGGKDTVEFDTQIDWQETHRMLKADFDSDVHTDMAYNEIQFGYIQRPTHRSRTYDQERYEVCNHRYTALCDAGHGVAVLNESKYGVSQLKSTISLTLLRASTSPDPHADRQVHHFIYAFTIWETDFLHSGVVREGYELNVPVTYCRGVRPALFALEVDAPNIIVETIKPAQDASGDIIVRLYECKQADTHFTLKVHIPFASAALCDMLENELEPLRTQGEQIALHAGAFKVLTLRLKKAHG